MKEYDDEYFYGSEELSKNVRMFMGEEADDEDASAPLKSEYATSAYAVHEGGDEPLKAEYASIGRLDIHFNEEKEDYEETSEDEDWDDEDYEPIRRERVRRKQKREESGRERRRRERARAERENQTKEKPQKKPENKSGKKAKKEPRRKSKFKRFLIIIALILIALLIFQKYMVNKVYNRMRYSGIASVEDESYRDENCINILLIGNDARSGVSGARSDAMILASINTRQKKIYLTSLLRDMYVEIPGHDNNRLNAAYSYGGAELLMDTIEKNFNIKVNRYVGVDFESFAKLTDIIGGIDLELTTGELELVNEYLIEYNQITGREIDTDFMDIGKPGLVHLNGPQALAYSRNRYIGSDFGRTERQRKVITAIIKKLPAAIIKNPDMTLQIIFENLETNLTEGECYRLSFLAPIIGTYDIESASLPVDGTYSDARIRDMEVLQVDFEANKRYLRDVVYGDGNTE